MKTDKQSFGKFGEDYTVKYLKKHGYKIVERNFHSRFGEIDIIAVNKKAIAFVEVKTRDENVRYAPRETVDYYKQQKCVKTAKLYLMVNQTNLQPRFDVSELIVDKSLLKYKVICHNYIENAFSGV